jgi:hypothetical protein
MPEEDIVFFCLVTLIIIIIIGSDLFLNTN